MPLGVLKLHMALVTGALLVFAVQVATRPLVRNDARETAVLAELMRVAALLLTLALTSCTLIPPYQRPAAPVPDRFPGAAATPTGTAGARIPAADIASQDFFADARLNELIRIALQNNRDLRIAVLNVQQTEAQYRITHAAVFPAVQGTAAYTRQSTSLSAEIPGFASNATFTSSTWSASVGVTSYELDLFGHVRSQNAQALEQYFQTEEAQRAAQVSLVGQVATQYLTLRETEELLKLSQDTLARGAVLLRSEQGDLRCRRQQ